MEAPKELLAIAVKGLGPPEKAQQLAEVVWKDAYARGFADAHARIMARLRTKFGPHFEANFFAELEALSPGAETEGV